METKTCPSCMEEVPVVADRCKHCFHDFNEEAPKKSGLFGLMLLLAAMGVTGALVVWLGNSQVEAQAMTKLSAETQQIVITKISKDERTVTTVDYADVARVEYVLGGEDYMHEVIVVTNKGDRYLIDADETKSLAGKAETRANQIGKARGTPCPMEKVVAIKTIGGE